MFYVKTLNNNLSKSEYFTDQFAQEGLFLFFSEIVHDVWLGNCLYHAEGNFFWVVCSFVLSIVQMSGAFPFYIENSISSMLSLIVCYCYYSDTNVYTERVSRESCATQEIVCCCRKGTAFLLSLLCSFYDY